MTTELTHHFERELNGRQIKGYIKYEAVIFKTELSGYDQAEINQCDMIDFEARYKDTNESVEDEFAEEIRDDEDANGNFTDIQQEAEYALGIE